MSLTLPALWNSVHRPIIYTIAPNYEYAFVGIDNGNAKLAISPTPNIGNFITGTSCIVTSGIYAGTHKILNVSGGYVTIDTPFISTPSGGIISTRVPVELYAGYDATHPGFADYPYGKVADITAIRGTDGNCKVDVSGYLQGVLKEVKEPRYGRDFQMSIPFKLVNANESQAMRYALKGTFKQSDLATYDADGKILNAREPIHFKNGRTIYSMIWNETTEFGEHIVNIVATNGTGNVGGIGFWEVGSTFIIQ